MHTTMSGRGGVALNRAEAAKFFGVALTTIDAWIRRGCPVLERGDRGVPHKLDSAEVAHWFAEDIARQNRRR